MDLLKISQIKQKFSLIVIRVKFPLVCIIIFSSYLQGQTKKTDSLYNIAIKGLFNEPKKSEEIGKFLYRNANRNPKLKIKSLMLLAQVSSILYEYEKVLSYATEALQISKEQNDHIDQLNIISFLGIYYQNISLKDKAWECQSQAEQLLRKYPLPDSLSYKKGNVYLNRAHLYKEDLDCNYANTYYDKAIKVFQTALPRKYSNEINLAVAYTHKGLCKLNSNDTDSAEYCFQKAITISKQNKSIGVKVFAQNSLAKVYSQKKQYGTSNQILESSLNLAKSASQKQLMLEIYNQLAENYFNMNDMKNFSYYNQLYQSGMINVNNSEKESIDKVAQAISNRKSLDDYQQKWIILVIILCFALLILLFLLVLRIMKWRKEMRNFIIK